MTSRNFTRFQPNKKDIMCKADDCVVRALCKALDKPWLEVYDILSEKARHLQRMPNSKKVYAEVLDENGFKYHGISNRKGTKRPTVAEFARKEKALCVMRVANHLVAGEGGKFFDTWDSGHKSLYGYWVKE